jgi:hypothetical protein
MFAPLSHFQYTLSMLFSKKLASRYGYTALCSHINCCSRLIGRLAALRLRSVLQDTGVQIPWVQPVRRAGRCHLISMFFEARRLMNRQMFRPTSPANLPANSGATHIARCRHRAKPVVAVYCASSALSKSRVICKRILATFHSE